MDVPICATRPPPSTRPGGCRHADAAAPATAPATAPVEAFSMTRFAQPPSVGDPDVASIRVTCDIFG